MGKSSFLFEVSWEVCNKVGGIHTVLFSKLRQVTKHFGNNYILIGPLRNRNYGFVEYEVVPEVLSDIKEILDKSDIDYKLGYWDGVGKATVILIEFSNRHKIDLLLYELWADFGVDSLASNYEYHEPILFSTTAGEVIEAISEILIPKYEVIAHFHEWLCGAGSLYVEKNCNRVATVFTTHATVLGRSLAHDNKLIYNLPSTFDPESSATRYNVFAKHSLEKASAQEADCFTTVSRITADEANIILGKYPDKIVHNGFDIKSKKNLEVPENINETRAKLLSVASKVLKKDIPSNALLWLTSGRYEFHNKGFDILLESLDQLSDLIPEDFPPIIVFFLVAAHRRTANDSLLDGDIDDDPEQKIALGISTHKVYDPKNDSILKLCNELDINKNEESNVYVVYSDSYLNGSDGVFDIDYEQIAAACDLSIFPSFYEPWGYTPLESISYGVPTITTDLAGFGDWALHLKRDGVGESIHVLARKDKDEKTIITSLCQYLLDVVKRYKDGDLDRKSIQQKTVEVATLADWEAFYKDYIDAYERAIRFNKLRFIAYESNTDFVTSIQTESVPEPRLRGFQFECPLPEPLKDLRDFAHNFWWSWHENTKILFQEINPDLWKKCEYNPLNFMNRVSKKDIESVIKNSKYMELYSDIIKTFNSYMSNKDFRGFCEAANFSSESPIAYFCMEYGLDECLPIYSGGLGILAGDYLKTMSDLRVPMIAIGLFYKRGYFLQKIDKDGEQIAIYKAWDKNQMPMALVNDEAGKAVLTGVEMLGRTVYMKTWEVKVGHINLYLLDTDVPENRPEDREITSSLYDSSPEIRLQQEMVLGIGGTKFILEKLNIKPILYHLNEGHSSFLLLERVRSYCHQGFSFEEACEIVKYSSVFTTHTPVASGNEVFRTDLIARYFDNYVKTIGIPMDKLLNLAIDVASENENPRVFSMTVLALRLTYTSNAVSLLHGKVARSMWNNIWRGVLEYEVPIEQVTNGVHLSCWLGDDMKSLYDNSLPDDWLIKQDEASIWEEVSNIPNNELWKAHQLQKEKLLELLRDLVVKQYGMRQESQRLIDDTLKTLKSDVLLIGISRRFTGYKRNDLILRDKEKLASIINNKERPVVILISGKAHPADGSGTKLIRKFVTALRDVQFGGHIIFLEEYNIGLAKALVQGVDVWLNTPILGREACGTSGMKAGVNGAINFSTRDGWWHEAYESKIGWEIPSLVYVNDIEKRNDLESMFLLNALDEKIVKLYYERNGEGFNDDWVEKMKSSINVVARNYNTYRMANDYINNLYCPSILEANKIMENDWSELKKIVAWKLSVAERFNTVKIKAVLIDGIKDGKITCEGDLKIKVLVFPGKLNVRELNVEFVLLKKDGDGFMQKPVIVPLKLVGSRSSKSEVLNYVEEYKIEEGIGFYSYGVRVFPYNTKLFRQHDVGLMFWG